MRTRKITAALGLIAATQLAGLVAATAASTPSGTAIHAVADGGGNGTGVYYHT